MRRRLGRTVRGVVGNARGSRWAWSREGDGRLLDNKERRGTAKPRPGAGASVPLPSSQPRQMSHFPPRDSAGRSGCPSKGRACGFLPDGGSPHPSKIEPILEPDTSCCPSGPRGGDLVAAVDWHTAEGAAGRKAVHEPRLCPRNAWALSPSTISRWTDEQTRRTGRPDLAPSPPPPAHRKHL